MGFFARLFKKVEQVNKQDISVKEFEASLELSEDEAREDAIDQWVEMAENIIVNTVKAAHIDVERAFILIDFDEKSPSFHIFYQQNGELLYWYELPDEDTREKIEQQLLPQAAEVTGHINSLFEEVNVEKIRYAQLQYESETMAWFSHIIWLSSAGASMKKEEILNQWFHRLKEATKHVALDSDEKLPWYP